MKTVKFNFSLPGLTSCLLRYTNFVNFNIGKKIDRSIVLYLLRMYDFCETLFVSLNVENKNILDESS